MATTPLPRGLRRPVGPSRALLGHSWDAHLTVRVQGVVWCKEKKEKGL